jgi:hypothetical protein
MKLLIFLLMVLILCSCVQKQITKEELSRYVMMEENGLTKRIDVDDYQIQITYRPRDLMVAQELSSPYDSSEWRLLQKKYDEHYYFVLSLSKNGKEALLASRMNYDQFSELVQTVSFRMTPFINMTTSKSDTIPLADYVYNPTFGLGASNDLLLIFSKDQIMNSKWVQIDLAEFGLGIGRQSLRFNCEDINDAPKVDFTSSK